MIRRGKTTGAYAWGREAAWIGSLRVRYPPGKRGRCFPTSAASCHRYKVRRKAARSSRATEAAKDP